MLPRVGISQRLVEELRGLEILRAPRDVDSGSSAAAQLQQLDRAAPAPAGRRGPSPSAELGDAGVRQDLRRHRAVSPKPTTVSTNAAAIGDPA